MVLRYFPKDSYFPLPHFQPFYVSRRMEKRFPSCPGWPGRSTGLPRKAAPQSVSGGKGSNEDSLSKSEQRGKSPEPNPCPVVGHGTCGVQKPPLPPRQRSRGTQVLVMETAAHKVDNSALQALITEKEIAKNIKEMTKNSAPGPDGITLGDLSKMDPKNSWMMEIFKLWIVSVTITDMGREYQTVLIPKSNKLDRLREINNWRPITICSIVLRLYSRIITARLTKACPIHLRQRGFLRAAGCSENLKLLQLLIRNPKKELRELAIVFVDIAFDTVSHHHILMGLKQKEVGPHVIHLTKNMYQNIDLCITTTKK